MELIEVSVERVIATTDNDFAVVLNSEEKPFLIFVGRAEVMVLYRELKGIVPQRPMSHDLIVNMIRAFDIEVRGVAISSIIDNVFCATLLLTQPSDDGNERNEVRLDLRASDAMIVALKTKSQLYVSREVLAQVTDATPFLDLDDGMGQAGLEG
ncbi:MAG: bifunctional DNase/RNase [Planctomycetota bacterium]|jgi:bifunctional DNase/RNase